MINANQKFIGKGESIGNQVELGKEYVRVHFGDSAVDKIVVYEDEGFSGGNLNRPAFKRMMDVAKKRQFKAISRKLWIYIGAYLTQPSKAVRSTVIQSAVSEL